MSTFVSLDFGHDEGEKLIITSSCGCITMHNSSSVVIRSFGELRSEHSNASASDIAQVNLLNVLSDACIFT